MKVLVINCGSSSFKYQLLDMEKEAVLCSGLAERIGQGKGALTHKKHNAAGDVEKLAIEEPFPTHTEALKKTLDLMIDSKWGVIKSIEEIGAIGHRVVMGGELIKEACVLDDKAIGVIQQLSPLAPLHNPANLQGVAVAKQLCPHAPSVGVFDTEFHATMPAKAYRYAVPTEYYTELGVRRYGFHGTSHKYVTRQAAEFLGKPVSEVNLITCHLGNGCSLTAVKGGKSVDTTMGMTPLAGVIMGTRCGDIDPAIVSFLVEQKKISAAEVDNILNKKSGLFALCGTNDMRDIHANREKGDKNAQLAFEMFCYSIKRSIGALWAVVGNVDAIVFTAGIGENDNFARIQCLEGLESWGVKVDPELNKVRSSDVRSISQAGTKIPVLVIPTNEELEIARTTLQVLGK